MMNYPKLLLTIYLPKPSIFEPNMFDPEPCTNLVVFVIVYILQCNLYETKKVPNQVLCIRYISLQAQSSSVICAHMLYCHNVIACDF